MSTTPTLRKLNDAVRSVHPPLIEGLEQRRLLAVDIQFTGPADVDEGSEAGYNFAFSGLPQGATFGGWQIDWGDGSGPSGSSDASPTLGHAYPDGESYATLCAGLYYVDAASIGQTYSESFYVHVGNVAPTLDVSADDSCEEGSAVNVYVSASDPGADTITQWHIDWGDGSSSQIYATGGGAVHVYPDGDGDFTINVYAYDEDGSYSAGPFDAFCGNVAPSLGIATNSGPFSEGSQVTLTTSVWDPGDDTIQGWIIDWGDGSGQDTYYADETMTHLYDDADGTGSTYHVSAQAWDEDGTYSAGSTAAVGVSNVEPSLTLDTNDEDGTLYGEDALTLDMAHATDPGDDTIYQWVIDWGDGTNDTFAGDPNSATHQYTEPGNYNINATAYDEDGSYSAGTSVVQATTYVVLPVNNDTARVTINVSGGTTSATQVMTELNRAGQRTGDELKYKNVQKTAGTSTAVLTVTRLPQLPGGNWNFQFTVGAGAVAGDTWTVIIHNPSHGAVESEPCTLTIVVT